MSNIKYERIPVDIDEADYYSKKDEYTVDEDKYSSGQDYSSIFSYNRQDQFKSFYTYGFSPTNQEDLDAARIIKPKTESVMKLVGETGLIIVCYVMVALTLPFSLLLSLKFVNQFERLVVYRLGRVQQPKGPGAVLILPCIESSKIVDMRIKAFHIPPIHAITRDGAVIEIGAVVYYCIKDALACVASVQDFSKIIRTLAHATLHRIMNKKTFSEIERDRKPVAETLKDELNSSTMTWGIVVSSVEMSDIKILKKPESNAASVLRTLCQPRVASSLWQTLTTGGMNAVPVFADSDNQVGTTPGHAPIVPENQANFGFDMSSFVAMLNSVCSKALVDEVGHSYQIVCTGLGEFYIDLRRDPGSVAIGRLADDQIDAKIELHPVDLLSLLSGQLSPLDGYMSGRIKVSGDTQAALKLKVVSNHVQQIQRI